MLLSGKSALFSECTWVRGFVGNQNQSKTACHWGPAAAGVLCSVVLVQVGGSDCGPGGRGRGSGSKAIQSQKETAPQ